MEIVDAGHPALIREPRGYPDVPVVEGCNVLEAKASVDAQQLVLAEICFGVASVLVP